MRRIVKTKTLRTLKNRCASDFRYWEALLWYLRPPEKQKKLLDKVPKVIWVEREGIASTKNTSLCCTPFGNIWAWEPLGAHKRFAKYVKVNK